MIGSVIVVVAVAGVVGGQVSQATKDVIDEKLQNLETSMYTVARQLMLQRMAFEEGMRTNGDSGVKQVRINRDGNEVWFSASPVSTATAAIHEHTELRQTCGMGELEAVLNGVHFRTRHNDCKLIKPSTTSNDYHASEDIEYPPVPPEILNQTDITKAFRDMRSYFRAWLEGNDTVLDYKPYFKPLFCNLEGAWTNDVDLDEPFDSDRHHIDASSWFDLQEKVRFTSYTGDKDQSENFAFLPTDDLLQLQHLKPTDDLHSRLATDKVLDKWLETRKGRYHISDRNGDKPSVGGQSLLDKLMAQIPGKDNYMANITDSNLGRIKYSVFENNQVLNTGFYHRYVFIRDKDAMGVQVNKRGFGDRNLYVSHTTQKRVVPVDLELCDRRGENCVYNSARVSYAIPLEIVWTTPLNTWNPFQLEYKGLFNTPEGQTVKADGRDGGLTADKAFNGTNSKKYFLTPIALFKGGAVDVDPADTVPGSVGVLDPWGNVRALTASGIRIFLPEMLDVGEVRIRYPIFPVYAEGNTAFKELEALSKVVMDLTDNLRYLHKVPQFGSNDTSDDSNLPNPDLTWYRLQTGEAVSRRGSHVHYVDLRSKHAIYAMDGCETFQVRTSLSKKHTHLMTIRYNSTSEQFEYINCDGRSTCQDNHQISFTPVKL